jgi:hypothetical protein
MDKHEYYRQKAIALLKTKGIDDLALVEFIAVLAFIYYHEDNNQDALFEAYSRLHSYLGWEVDVGETLSANQDEIMAYVLEIIEQEKGKSGGHKEDARRYPPNGDH